MIDTMVYVADIAIDTYAAGDAVTFTQIAGPTVVRDGLGQPILKSINTGAFLHKTGALAMVEFKVKNSNWNDPIYNAPSAMSDATGLSENSTGYQPGFDCPLQVNSSFEVSAEWIQPQTTTILNTVYVTIDIEYPDLPAIVNPSLETGTPCSIMYEFDSYDIPALGAVESQAWKAVSFDSFKAGYRYLMQKVSIGCYGTANTIYGFVKFSDGASMGGLSRIIPISSASSAVGKQITYASPEVKGPVTVSLLMTAQSAITSAVIVTCDYVKR